MSEVRTEFTGDATSIAAASKQAQEGINGVLQTTDKAAASLGQLNQISELTAKAQKGLTAASAFLATGTAAVTTAVKAQTAAFLASPVGVVAVAVLALGAAYAVLAKEAEAANKKVEASAKAATEAQRAMEKLSALRTSTADKEALALGLVTQADLDLRDALAEVTALFGPRIAAQEAAIAAAEREGKSTEQLRASLAGLVEQQGQLLQSTTRGIVLTEADRKAKLAKAAADKAAAAAAREGATAEERWAEALAEGTIYNLDRAAKASTERAKIEAENAEIIAEATEAGALRQMEAEEELRQRRIEIEEERAAMYEQGIEDRKELDRDYAEAAAAVALESLALIEDLAERELDTRSSIIDTLQARLAEGEDTLTDKQKEALKERIAAEKEAALAAFNVAKGVAAAQAAISTALAIVNALATPVPYPVAVAFAVAAGIAGTASTVAILAEPEPTFHTGGVFMPDEGRATLRAGEGIMTPETTRAMGGPAGISEANRTQGRSLMGGGASFRIGRREVAEIERTGVRAGGPMTRRIRQEVRRGALGAGRSTRGARS